MYCLSINKNNSTKTLIAWVFSAITIISFSGAQASEIKTTTVSKDVTQWVDPFIGTGGDGHTFPGAVVPFGMVQLSPDTAAVSRGVDPQAEIYKHSAGYHYDDNTITGFSHTHFSGTGHSDLGDLLIMPMTGTAHTDVGSVENPDSGYRSRFSHNKESASPGYYAVELTDYNIQAELTATARCGFHRYTPPTDWFGVDTFTYLVSDKEGLDSNIATVSVTVTDVNHAPTAVAATSAVSPPPRNRQRTPPTTRDR